MQGGSHGSPVLLGRLWQPGYPEDWSPSGPVAFPAGPISEAYGPPANPGEQASSDYSEFGFVGLFILPLEQQIRCQFPRNL